MVEESEEEEEEEEEEEAEEEAVVFSLTTGAQVHALLPRQGKVQGVLIVSLFSSTNIPAPRPLSGRCILRAAAK